VAKLRLEHAAAKLQLTRELSAKGLASGSALEDAKLGENLARAELDTLQKLDPTLPEKELDVMRRERDAAADAVAMADARLRSRQVRAPFAGRVVRYSFVVGELVKPDNVLYELFGREETVLKLRVPERYATLVATGQTYRAQLLPYRHSLLRRWFRGTVTELRDVIETENKTTYRVAYCRFDAQGEDVPPGTTAEAQIRVGRTPLWKTVLGLY
jgi:multidrug resistance efflux pump